jgi:AcrR family transcriptional regulator
MSEKQEHRQTRRRGPGRPSGDPAVRQRLLEAARDLCIERGFDAASSKAIAARAGVNPAMINYYFESKEGLSTAMMRSVIAPILAQLDAVEANPAGRVTLDAFMRAYMRALAANPWLPKLVIREVLPANGRFRKLFVDELVQRAGRLLQQIIDHDPRLCDTTLDPRFALVSVASLAVFPFMAAPIIEAAVGVRIEQAAVLNGFIDHSVRVLQQGLHGRGDDS